MNEAVRNRMFGVQHAFDEPVTLWATVGIVGAAVLAGVAIALLGRLKVISPDTHADAWRRWKTWLWLGAVVLTPILLGAAWTMAAVAVLSLGCYREYARATGVFRDKMISASVVAGILLVTFAAVDHFDRMFFAAAPLTACLIAIATIPRDEPRGYVQRVALGIFGFLMFGFCLGYVGYFANASGYRPVLLLLLIGVAVSDVSAYCVGKMLGRRKLAPKTSPGKTVAGSLGSLVITSAAVAVLGHFVFSGTPVDRVWWLLILGLLISALGQLGDLILSSIKRDVGVKDLGTTIPGHGGLLDRFDSLVLPAPAVFHYLSLLLGPWAADEPTRIITGG
ncbi:MAG: phosphatidate cytidylyltransferase [Planctomycetota bacterium]|jgi:phosphatidate cytidylyltransferase